MSNLLRPAEGRPATEEQKALFAMPPLMDSFPVVLGEYTWKEFSVLCSVCETAIQRDDLRGRVDLSEHGVALLEALGFCVSCGAYSAASFALNDAGHLLAMKDGKWEIQPVKTGFWDDLSKILDL